MLNKNQMALLIDLKLFTLSSDQKSKWDSYLEQTEFQQFRQLYNNKFWIRTGSKV